MFGDERQTTTNNHEPSWTYHGVGTAAAAAAGGAPRGVGGASEEKAAGAAWAVRGPCAGVGLELGRAALRGAVRSARRPVRGRERGVRDCEWPATGAWVFTVPAADWPLLPTALWRLESACGLRSSAVRRERQRLPGKRRGRLGCFGASMWCCGAVQLVRRAFEFARVRLVHGLGAERRTAGARRLRLNGSPWAGRGEPVSGVSGEAVCEHAAAACCVCVLLLLLTGAHRAPPATGSLMVAPRRPQASKRALEGRRLAHPCS